MFMELRNIAFSKWAAGITSWKEDVQTFLREVVIVGQDVRQACTAHHLHGHTIGEAVGLVRADAVQRQSVQKQAAGRLHDLHLGIVEQLIDQQNGFVAQVCPRRAQSRKQLRKDRIGREDPVGVREHLTKSRYTGMPRVTPIQQGYPIKRIREQTAHVYRFGVP